MSNAGPSGSQQDLRQQLQGSVADSLIPNEDPDPEQQPLRRTNSPVTNRERFQHNQRTTAHGLVQRSGWLFLVVMILVSILFFAWVIFYIGGWSVWRAHRTKPCDQPLANWLLAMLILPLVALCAECCQARTFRILVIFVTLLQLLIGLRMFFKSKTCKDTNPDLYVFVRQYLIFLSIWWICWVVMPLVFLAVVIYGMMNGWFNELNAGASPEAIKQIDTVAYDPELFAQEGKEDGRPAAECCICTESFGASRDIKRTPCQHYFHEKCLGDWLKVSTTCPLCRMDLERAALGDAAPCREERQAAGAGWPGAGNGWMGPNYGALPDAAPTARETDEVRALLQTFPDLDESTALLAVRNHGTATEAAAFLGSP
jgi:hypothetical protein